MSGQNNSLTNSNMTHKGAGLHSAGMGQRDVSLGLVSKNMKEERDLIPVHSLMRDLKDLSPYAFRVKQVTAVSGVVVPKYPCVLYDYLAFGTLEDAAPKKKWRMYVQDNDGVTDAMFYSQSDDGIIWDAATTLDATVILPNPAHPMKGMQVFYDAQGLVVVAGVTYNWAAMYKVDNSVVGNMTDMAMVYSLDGITWIKAAMAEHAANTPAMYAGYTGQGAAYIGRTGEVTEATYAVAAPRTYFNAAGDYIAMMRLNDGAAVGADVGRLELLGCNSATPADWNKLGFFTNWIRNLLSGQTGERSFGQVNKSEVFHVQRYKDVFIGLVQIKYDGGAVSVDAGLALAISKDGLIFDYMGPLYDAGLVVSYNETTSTVVATDGASTAWLLSHGSGDGTQIVAGSVVVDKSGNNFSKNCGPLLNDRHLLRVYWTEHTSNKIVMGYI